MNINDRNRKILIDIGTVNNNIEERKIVSIIIIIETRQEINRNIETKN